MSTGHLQHDGPTGDFWRTLSYGLDTTAELPPERGLVILNRQLFKIQSWSTFVKSNRELGEVSAQLLEGSIFGFDESDSFQI